MGWEAHWLSWLINAYSRPLFMADDFDL